MPENRRCFTLQLIGKHLPCAASKQSGLKPNLKKVCGWKVLRPNAQSLREEPYNLTDDAKILIMKHETIFNCKWKKKGYRKIPVKIFYGTLAELDVFLRAWYRENVWDKNKERLRLKREMEAGKGTEEKK